MLSETTLYKESGGTHPIHQATHFRLQSKGLKDISALGQCKNAKAIFLYENEIEELDENFEQLKRLALLDLSNNLLTRIDHLCCKNLTKLYLDHNRLTRIANLHACVNLVELSASNQKTDEPLEFEFESIQAISGSLKRLSMSGNRIRNISNLRSFSNLEFLDISNNNISDENEMLGPLMEMKSLVTLDTRNNPYHQESSRSWEKVVACTQMNTTSVDDKIVTPEQRVFMRRLLHPRLRRGNADQAKSGDKHTVQLPQVNAVSIRRGFRHNDGASAAAQHWYGNMKENAANE